jgi:citrate lyase subunit beta/citryl-CoA lyase
MFVPINNPRFVEKAWTRGSDAIILDLEDSVPMSEKEKARSLIRETIPKVAKGGASVFVRINKEFIKADLQAAIWPGISRIILPKVQTAEDVQTVDALITALEKERGIEVGWIEIFPLLESARSIANSYAIATASPRVKVMPNGWGYDTALDIEIEMFADFDQYVYMREEPFLAAMAAGAECTGAPHIPGTTGKVGQKEEGETLAEALRKLQVHEAMILHPALVEPMVTGLVPLAEEVEWAKKVAAVYDELEQDGEGVTEIEGKVIDVYEHQHAQDLLSWAEACASMDRRKARAVAKAQSEPTSADNSPGNTKQV